jgi:hypothetical protein
MKLPLLVPTAPNEPQTESQFSGSRPRRRQHRKTWWAAAPRPSQPLELSAIQTQRGPRGLARPLERNIGHAQSAREMRRRIETTMQASRRNFGRVPTYLPRVRPELNQQEASQVVKPRRGPKDTDSRRAPLSRHKSTKQLARENKIEEIHLNRMRQDDLAAVSCCTGV